MGFKGVHVVPDDLEVTFIGPPEGVHSRNLAAWKEARDLLGDLKPLPLDVLTLAVFLTATDDPDGEEDEPEEDEPGFAPPMMIDWFSPVRLLRRLLG